MPDPQNLHNHRQRVPTFLVVTGLFLVDFLWAGWRLYQSPSIDAVLAVVVPAALIVLAFQLRRFTLKVQDRVIRLEMRLRLQSTLPPELQARIAQLEIRQLVALRFASDEELPDLVSRVLESDIRDQNAIKAMIKVWQADHHRA